MNDKPNIDPTRKISIPAFQKVHQAFFCYGWWRTNHYLYIGVTTIGYRRFVSHTTLGRVEPFQDNDEIHFWDIDIGNIDPTWKGVYEAKAKATVHLLESKLIAKWNPLYNQNKNYNAQVTQTPIACAFCKENFTPSRAWQKFCSTKCQTDSWVAGKTKRIAVKNNEILQRPCNFCHTVYEISNLDFAQKGGIYCPACRPMAA
jgi:hypothetical protein